MDVSWPMVQREQAFRQIRAAVATCGDRGHATGVGPSRAIELAHIAAKCAAESVHERLAKMVATVDGDLVPLYARHASALENEDADALEQSARDFEALGALLSAVDAFAHAAVRHGADGNRGRAVAAGTAAYRLAAQCGNVTTPALLAVPDPSPLTAREREIAGLIAGGLSNADIAQRLILSARTVESHIYRACAKLDVTDREQLAAIAGQMPANRVM